jgi:hypothetical protein
MVAAVIQARIARRVVGQMREPVLAGVGRESLDPVGSGRVIPGHVIREIAQESLRNISSTTSRG